MFNTFAGSDQQSSIILINYGGAEGQREPLILGGNASDSHIIGAKGEHETGSVKDLEEEEDPEDDPDDQYVCWFLSTIMNMMITFNLFKI